MDRVSFLPADHEPSRPPGGASPQEFATAIASSFGKREAVLTSNGRAAMSALFARLDLRREDEVFVATTFDLPNVSSCVTCTIFNFCKPSRTLTPQTRAIFVIHEFGAPHPCTPEWRRETQRRGIPLIEDCAHTIDSVSEEGWRAGAVGDWTIVTFPKIFPAYTGGMLVGPGAAVAESARQQERAMAGARAACAWWPSHDEQMERRRGVYTELSRRSRELGRPPLFEMRPGITPWMFPVPVADPEPVLERAAAAGVDCGLWHGSPLVVFPCHQFIDDEGIGRIIDTLKA